MSLAISTASEMKFERSSVESSRLTIYWYTLENPPPGEKCALFRNCVRMYTEGVHLIGKGVHYLETENVQGCALIGKGVHYLESVCTF